MFWMLTEDPNYDELGQLIDDEAFEAIVAEELAAEFA